MALATRCPACGSVFRVVADQLKLRGGLVRCGQCGTVFDAIGALTYLDDAQLRQAQVGAPAAPPATPQAVSFEKPARPQPDFELPAEAPFATTPSSTEPDAAPAIEVAPPPAIASEAEAAPAPAPAPEPEAAPAQAATFEPEGLPERAAEAFRELAAALATTPALPAPARKTAADDEAPQPTEAEVQPEPQPDAEPATEAALTAEVTAPSALDEPLAREADTRAEHAESAESSESTEPVDAIAPVDALAAMPPAEVDTVAPPPSAQAATQDAVPATLAEPEFLRRASEQARVVRHRKVWAVASLLAALVLAAQLLFAFRSEVLMRWPQAQPIYVQVCEQLGCTVEWPAVSDQIAVLASDLQRLPGTPAYELNVTLRNRAPYPQTLPALEVTLTDARGQVIARRVVPAAEYRLEGQPDHLAPGEDLAARLVFEAAGAAPAGFLVYPFHP